MNLKAISNLLFASICAAATNSAVPTKTDSVTNGATKTSPNSAVPGNHPVQGFMNFHFRVGPFDMVNFQKILGGSGSRTDPNNTSGAQVASTGGKDGLASAQSASQVAGTTSGQAAGQQSGSSTAAQANDGRYRPPPGKLYRARDDPRIMHLIELGSPEENRKFELEAGVLYKAREARGGKGHKETDPLIKERQAWFKAERQRRLAIWNKLHGEAATDKAAVQPVLNKRGVAKKHQPPGPNATEAEKQKYEADKKARRDAKHGAAGKAAGPVLNKRGVAKKHQPPGPNATEAEKQKYEADKKARKDAKQRAAGHQSQSAPTPPPQPKGGLDKAKSAGMSAFAKAKAKLAAKGKH